MSHPTAIGGRPTIYEIPIAIGRARVAFYKIRKSLFKIVYKKSWQFFSLPFYLQRIVMPSRIRLKVLKSNENRRGISNFVESEMPRSSA